RDVNATAYGRAAYAFNLTQSDADISYLYSVDDQRMYKEVETASETKREYYLSDAMGKVVALRTETMPSEGGSYYNWEFYAHGAEREARLTPIHGAGPFGRDEVTFFLYDHLGNTRVTYIPVYRPETEIVMDSIVSVMDYFP